MNFLKLQEGIKVPVDFDATRLIIRNDIEMIHIRLEPGQKLDLHKNPVDVIFYVLQGKGLFTCENQEITLEKDTTVFVENTELP